MKCYINSIILQIIIGFETSCFVWCFINSQDSAKNRIVQHSEVKSLLVEHFYFYETFFSTLWCFGSCQQRQRLRKKPCVSALALDGMTGAVVEHNNIILKKLNDITLFQSYPLCPIHVVSFTRQIIFKREEETWPVLFWI